MARYRKLDRNGLLDAAYEVIITQGAHALSIGNVAKAAGVTKGGIQSNFGTREGLIEALFERWSQDLDAAISEYAQRPDAPQDELSLFLRASLEQHKRNPRQNAAMMFLMSQNMEHREAARDWISDRLDQFGLRRPEARQGRLRFIIFEALITMKSMELAAFDEREWAEIIEDADRLVGQAEQHTSAEDGPGEDLPETKAEN